MGFKHSLCIWQVFLFLILLKNTWNSKSGLSAVVAERAIQQIPSLSCLSGCWLKQHNFFSRLFWTDLPFCCPDGIFAFKHRSCGQRIIGAFLFFLWRLCFAVSLGMQLGQEIRAGLPWSWLAHSSTSFPAHELSKKTGSSSTPGISFELKLLCVPAQALVLVPCKTTLQSCPLYLCWWTGEQLAGPALSIGH